MKGGRETWDLGSLREVAPSEGSPTCLPAARTQLVPLLPCKYCATTIAIAIATSAMKALVEVVLSLVTIAVAGDSTIAAWVRLLVSSRTRIPATLS